MIADMLRVYCRDCASRMRIRVVRYVMRVRECILISAQQRGGAGSVAVYIRA